MFVVSFGGSITMTQLVSRFTKDESGATAIEYGLIAALIAVVCITIWTQVGTRLIARFTTVSNALNR
jgi:pilus assembly protein Flp/PilA